MSRESFIAGLNRALGTSIRTFPSLDLLRRYFATLAPDAAIRAYEDYASSFYVHIAVSSRNPAADVTYPGGACDRWQEVTGGRRSEGRRVIDCEGFAYIAHELLRAAGFNPAGYQVFYIPTAGQPSDWHIVAVLEPPDGGPRVYVGGPQVSRQAFEEIRRVYPRRSHDARRAQIGETALQAIDNMQREAALGRVREVAPLAPRRGATVPPVVAE
jgi:hypothetical protein